jgi:PAS domain S-box-containing protein
VILRPDHSIAYFSPFAEHLTGRTATETMHRDYFTLFLAESERERWTATVQAALQGDTVREFSSEIRCRNGEPRTLVWNARRLEHFDDRPAVLVVGHDITSLRNAQTAALEAERLAAIGKMAAGIAHESRNALQRIQACAESLELDVQGNPEALEGVRRIQSAQRRLNLLFDEVRSYAGGIRLDRAEWDLPGIWREAWELLAPQRAGRDAVLIEQAPADVPACSVDRFRMTQVFHNILENALAACGDAGRIECHCESASLRGRPAVRIRVGDNGPGMDSEQKRRIFEPFFTTKPNGTGLGRAIAQRFVQAHAGTIEVGDSPLGGAEITVTLPIESR